MDFAWARYRPVPKTSAIAARSRQLFSLCTSIAFPVSVHKRRVPAPGWRLMGRLGMPLSPDTLIRRPKEGTKTAPKLRQSRIKCSSLRFKCNKLLYLNRGLPGSAVYDLSTDRQLLKVSPSITEVFPLFLVPRESPGARLHVASSN
jgi:hypothetical protein